MNWDILDSGFPFALVILTGILFAIATFGKAILLFLVNRWLEGRASLRQLFSFPKNQILLSLSLLVFLGLFFSVYSLFKTRSLEMEISQNQKSVDILFIVDVSLSMNAEDVLPNRLKQFQDVLLRSLPALQGNRLGIIVFAGSAFAFCPMTSDLAAFSDYVKALGPDMIGEKGTSLDSAFAKAKELLASQKLYRQRIVVLASDGEDFENPSLGLLDAKIVVWGFGTNEGGPIAYKDEDTGFSGYVNKSGILTDDPYSPYVIRSKANFDILNSFATRNGGQFYSISDNPNYAENLVQLANSMQANDTKQNSKIRKEDGAGIFLLLAVLFLFSEKLIRLFLKSGTILLVLFAFHPKEVFSIEWSINPGGKHLESSKELYDNKNFNGAKEKLQEAEKHFPNDPRMNYNRGTIDYKLGNLPEAEKQFSESMKNPLLPDSTKAKSSYNLGNTFAKQGNAKKALEYYEKALALNPDHLASKKNIELLRRKSNQTPPPNQGEQNSESESNSGSEPKESQGEKNQSQSQKRDKSDKETAEEMMDSYRPDSVMKRKQKGFPSREKDVFW